MEELVGGKDPGSVAPPRSKKGQEGAKEMSGEERLPEER